MEKTQAVAKSAARDLEILKKSGVLKGFYLAGDTGLALLLGHRKSYDLDFFRKNEFNENKLVELLRKYGRFSVEKKEAGTVQGIFKDTCVSFFHYPYPLLKKTVRDSVDVASLEDIACMKLDAIASRGTKRDFVDIFIILQKGRFSLSGLLKLYAKKYRAFSPNILHLKKSLVYFVDADRDPMPRMILHVTWKIAKNFIIQEVRKI